MSIRMIGLVMVVAVLAMWTGPVQALDVTNNGVQIFLDDFESQSLNVYPSTGGMPAGAPGTWSANAAHRVRDNATGPGPFSGNQYMEVGPTSGFETSNAVFDSVQTSGNIHIKYMMYLPAASMPGSVGFKLTNSSGDDGSRLLRFQLSSAAGGAQIQDGATSAKGPFLPHDIWSLIEIEHTLGTGTYDVTVTPDGGVASTATKSGIRGTGLVSMGLISFDAENTSYYDFVPEPSTMALLGLGGLMILRRRRSA